MDLDDIKKYNVYEFLNHDNVYITPNMTYKPRVCKKPLGTIVNGSVAILIPKGNIKLTEKDLLFFSTEEYRNKHIGSKLVEEVEKYFENKGFENINLTTYEFQAPEFYKKCGFEVEFIRENKQNKKLNKYFLVKYI